MSTRTAQCANTLPIAALAVLLCSACGSDRDGSQSMEPVVLPPAGDSGPLRADASAGPGPSPSDASSPPTGAPGKDSGVAASDSSVRDAGPGSSGQNDAATAVDDASAADAAKATDSSSADATSVDVACNPADKTPGATPVSGIGTGAKPAGMFATVVESDPGLAGYTIFRPEPLGMIKHPILTWGNGGCTKNVSGFSEFLLQLAAEGIVVIADGAPGASGSSADNGSQLIKAMDWIEKENERPCSTYYHKLDATKMGVSGQSCGGLMAINASGDKRVAVSMPMNSGLMSRNTALYAKLHAPMAIINGGSSDIAYANGNADFEAINSIPIMVANIPVGHGGTYREDNAGEMGKMAIAWLRWHLLGDQGASGKGMFIGTSCGFCSSQWDLKWKMKPQ
jgi:hypothetical protein